MGIIRFSDEEVFGTDSQEYDILRDAAREAAQVPGAAIEIGTRRGGSAKMIMDALAGSIPNRPMFCIDPYGNIEIDCTNLNMSIHNPDRKIEGDPSSKEITSPQRFDYDNNMRNRIIPSLYYYGYANGFDFSFFCLEDTEFFKRYADGVPTYNEQKIMVNEYAFVFFDGPHDNKCLELETEFFLERSVVGTVFVYDDIWMYDHARVVEEKIFAAGFETLEKGNIKASYKKVR